jgi:alpha-1,6-mannosyltransferase
VSYKLTILGKSIWRKMRTKKNIFYIAVLMLCILFSLFALLKLKPVENFTIIYISSSLLFVLICFLILKIELHFREVAAFIIVGILIRISFINTQPIGSDDVYRYMWDGRVQVNGINPYTYAPNNNALQTLHSELLPRFVNFPEFKTIYFPFSQWLFYTGYQISGESVWGYKLLLLVFELLTFFALFLLTKKTELPPKFILFYVLCPLPIIHFSLDAHLDGFGLPLLLFSILFYLNERKILSLIFLGLSLSIKPVGLLLVPIFFFNEKNIVERIKILIIPFVAFFIQFIPYIFTSNPFEMFFVYAKNWTFNGIVFNILNAFINNNQTAREICALLLVIALIPLFISKKEIIIKFYYSILILFIFSPVVHPWYVAWLAILLPLFPRWSGLIFISLSSLTSITVLNYQLHGKWNDYPLVLAAEYVPLLILLGWELMKNKPKIEFIRKLK